MRSHLGFGTVADAAIEEFGFGAGWVLAGIVDDDPPMTALC